VLLPVSKSDRVIRSRRRIASAAPLLAWAMFAGAMAVSVPVQAQGTPLSRPGAANVVGASMLSGKLRFELPDGFDRTALPPDAKRGKDVVYLHPGRQQMVLTTESPTGSRVNVGEDDRKFLDASLAAHLAELDKPVPNYRRLATRAYAFKGLGLRRTDGTSTFFDQPVRTSSLVAGNGVVVSVVMIMSGIDDEAGHHALVARILDSIAANR
jgi:hypothetical protein